MDSLTLSHSIPYLELVHHFFIIWDKQRHIPIDFFQNDKSIEEIIVLRDNIPIGGHKNNFFINLYAYMYFMDKVKFHC